MNDELFDQTPPDSGSRTPRDTTTGADGPLADRMRPRSLAEMVGQADVVGPRGALRPLLEAGDFPSLLLWGPPGCGKTTLARLVSLHAEARFIEYSAVSVGTKLLKEVMAEAARLRRATGRRTILFLDEIHRFNKAQQDALLPWVERGDITLIGATTENPSFEVNAALISRTRLFVLKPLAAADVQALLRRALEDERGFAGTNPTVTDEALEALARLSEGDARAALTLLESVVAACGTEDANIEATDLDRLIQHRAARYDKSGDEHFNLISALHKSLRNSDEQAALYWLARMLAGGEDPLYIARRLVRFASEDVGLADPSALQRAIAARDAVHFIGLPEGQLALAQITIYLALAPKSNSVYAAFKKVEQEIARGHNPEVPLHIRNAPTRLMKDLDYGRGYIYAHDTEEGLADMDCLPASLQGRAWYHPGDSAFESRLAQRMEEIAAWRRDTTRRQGEEKGDE